MEYHPDCSVQHLVAMHLHSECSGHWQIPTAAEFRDAIESLSPEQQAFCTAYRKMQLEGNVFAVREVQTGDHLVMGARRCPSIAHRWAFLVRRRLP
eukprot:SAG31_NODE_326_length_17664_cov_10.038543_2_plen_96_part_00